MAGRSAGLQHRNDDEDSEWGVYRCWWSTNGLRQCLMKPNLRTPVSGGEILVTGGLGRKRRCSEAQIALSERQETVHTDTAPKSSKGKIFE